MLADLKIAYRRLMASPGFTITVLITLGLTVALSTTVFSVLDAMLFRHLPYNHPERIVNVQTYSPQGFTQPASYPEYLDWRKDAKAFSALAGYWAFTDGNLDTGGSAVAAHSVSATDNFFDVFAVRPLLGRSFKHGETTTVVLSNEIWRSVFASDPNVIGRMVKLDGQARTVIGVMPPGFRFPINRTDAVYYLLQPTEQQKSGRGNHFLFTIARLRDGITASAAQQSFNQVLRQLGKVYPDTAGRRAELIDAPNWIGGQNRQALRLLFYAVLVILAIGCVNLSGMLLARAIRFQREMAVRAALGASRAALIRQILAENMVYGLAGGAFGVILAYGLLQATSALLVAALPRGSEVTLNLPVLCVALACAISCSLLAGLAPAMGLSQADANSALRTGLRAGVQRGHTRLRSSFVVVQVGLALTLLFTAAILLKTLSGFINEPMGFDAAHILTAEIDLSAGNYANKSMWADFYKPLLDRIQALPGVRAAGIISLLPIQNSGWNESVHMTGQPPNPPNEARLSEIRFVSAGYYRVFGLHLLDGHLLDDSTQPTSERTQVVNQRFVDLYIPKGHNPVGMYMDEGDEKVRIVGVVSNVRHQIYDPPYAEMDWPIAQVPPEFLRGSFLSTMHLVVRTDGSPKTVIPALRSIYRRLDPSLPFRSPETMTQIIAESLNFERLENWLFGSFAALAFLLAIVGLYGVISHEVHTSTRDIGVRIAVGAQVRNIFGLIYRRVGVMLIVGLAAGSFATWGARKLIGSVVPLHLDQDGWVFGVVLAGFALIAVGAAFLPARAATKVDPVQALRTD